MENKLYIDFKLPTETGMVVSTMTDDPTNANDITVKSFIAYSKQAFLPKIKDRLPFPISTVLSVPNKPDESAVFAPVKDDSETKTNPFFAGSIPFLYGSEDYDKQTNKILDNLKWPDKKRDKDYPYARASFINELLFLAQVFAMGKHADLNQCSIYWTYPLSMSKKMIEQLQTLWIKGYQKYFEGLTEESEDNEPHKNVNSFPESMAPMLFYTSNLKYGIKPSKTTISVDIGGGTCDLVIIPSKLSKLKLTSFKFGAECIFGINTEAESIAMFKNAIKSISKAIKGRAVDSNPNKGDLIKKAKELEGKMAEGCHAKEMSTYLFNLSNNPLFAGMGKQVDFNQWIQDHPLYHTVFLYYYAALIYYIAELWKTFKTAEKPSRILFSGSGSKMFNILSGGDNSVLSDYTTQLFNIFAKDELDEEDLEEDIRVKMEVKEPKQITAKGVLAYSDTMEAIKKDMLEWSSASVDGKDYIFNFDMVSEAGKTLTYGDLEEDDLIESLYERFGEFHEGLMKFLKDNEEDFDEDCVEDMKRMFTEKCKTSKKWCRSIAAALGEVVENTTGNRNDEYPDVPFFEVVKSFIKDAMIPEY
ncbi:MAG: hypothetical protein K2G23_01280 [Muribaculaceae bacterium]|nr:hypothetical protein [Muribaculaceae bacterium]